MNSIQNSAQVETLLIDTTLCVGVVKMLQKESVSTIEANSGEVAIQKGTI